MIITFWNLFIVFLEWNLFTTVTLTKSISIRTLLHQVRVVIPLTVSCSERLKSDLTFSQDKDREYWFSDQSWPDDTLYPADPSCKYNILFKHQKLTCLNQNLKSDPLCTGGKCVFLQEQGTKRGYVGEIMQLWPTSGGRKNKVVDSATPSSLLPSRRINI